MAAAAQKNRLSDGRTFRPLGTFTQAQMFRLHTINLFDPKTESIMSVKELDDALNVSGAWEALDVLGIPFWKTSRYGVYARGFEMELDKPVGASVVYVADSVPYTFEVPDVKHPHDKNKGLRQATGMLDFALDKLQYDEDRRIVSVTDSFNPQCDVAVKDIMRPRGWALVDADGYPLRTKPSDKDNSEARYSVILHSDEFEGKSTGCHGSVTRSSYISLNWRDINIKFVWRGVSGVAAVSREGNSK